MTRKLLFFILLAISGLCRAQDLCSLGVGGPDHEIIAEVFQLSQDQVKTMRNLGAELKFRNEIFELRAERLLKNHAQSSPEDLLKMSYDYRDLLDSMRNNSVRIDKRMLAVFNQDQYNLYIQLCNQAYRSPIFALRSVDEK
ncbi:MAG: hypothetical protein HRT65_15290 [Flavobacteriaceae bacterium]|nr:hypothetical protein [Flavobacteriaceae bacterium]